MKKQNVKKLVLAKETLQTLGEVDLKAPRGGTTLSVYRPCFFTEQPSCRC